MKLGMWARTIIVLSVFWMAGGTFWFAKIQADEATQTATEFYDDCVKHPTRGFDCWAAREDIFRAHTDQIQGGLWGASAIQAAMVLVLALIVIAIVSGAVRWILAGAARKRHRPNDRRCESARLSEG